MDATTIQALYEYDRWANARILDAAEKLTAEQFSRDLHSSHGSVRETLVHILSAEWIWLMRWLGQSPKAMLDPAELSTMAALRARWTMVEIELAEFVSRLTEESLRQEIRYQDTRGVTYTYLLWKMMQHVTHHSTFHRGQVVAMLRQLGAVPPATDFLDFDYLKQGRV